MGNVSSPDSCSRSKGGFSGFGTVQYKLLKNNYFDELIGEEIKSYREIFGTKFTGLKFPATNFEMRRDRCGWLLPQ